MTLDNSLEAVRSVVESRVEGELHFHVVTFPGNRPSPRFDAKAEADYRAQELLAQYDHLRFVVRSCRKACR